MRTAMHHPVVLSAEQITRSEPQNEHTLCSKNEQDFGLLVPSSMVQHLELDRVVS